MNPSLQAAFEDEDLIDVSQYIHIKVDLRYAGTNNFMNTNVYEDFTICYLHRIAAQKLKKATGELHLLRPGWKFLLLDCLRPRSIQRKLWNYVKGTDKQIYVANPDKGSVHNYGFAVDLTLLDEHGNEVDMGTPYDSFTELSQPKLESQFLESGELTKKQESNRLMLRDAMETAGFRQLSVEWWHYDAEIPSVVRKNYTILE